MFFEIVGDHALTLTIIKGSKSLKQILETMKRELYYEGQETHFSSDVLLKKDINELVNSFSDTHDFLFTGVICKEWAIQSSNTTSIFRVTTGRRIKEYMNTHAFDLDAVADLMRHMAKHVEVDFIMTSMAKIHRYYERTTGEKFPWDHQCILETHKDSDEYYEDLTFRNILGAVAVRGNIGALRWLHTSGCLFSRHLDVSTQYWGEIPGEDVCSLANSLRVMYDSPASEHTSRFEISLCLLDNMCPVRSIIRENRRYFIESDLHIGCSEERFIMLASSKGNSMGLITVIHHAESFTRQNGGYGEAGLPSTMVAEASAIIDRHIRDLGK